MKRMLVLATICIWVSEAQAAYIIDLLNEAVTENFDHWDGTGPPPNWMLNAPHKSDYNSEQATFRGNGNGSSTEGGWWSYGMVGNDDRSLGFLGNANYGGGLGNGTPGNNGLNFATMMAAFKNESGSLITGLIISYYGEQWREAISRDSHILFDYSLDGSAWTGVPALTFHAVGNEATGARNGDSLDWRSHLNANIHDLAIENGDTFYLRWSYNGGDGSGSRQGLSIDGISVTAIPEPLGVTLMVMLGGLLFACRRRAR